MKTWILISLTFTLASCGQKTVLSIKEASNQLCDCFNSQTTDSIDDRLNPCLQKIADEKENDLRNSGISDQDSILGKISKFSLDVLLEMTNSCDNYFAAINDLYDKSYSIDTTTLNKNAIKELTVRISAETNRDSVKSLLHKMVYKLIQARKFDWALQSIDTIKSLDETDYGANLASAYIFNQIGQHDKAIDEIEKAIELSGNESLRLYAEISKKRKTVKNRR